MLKAEVHVEGAEEWGFASVAEGKVGGETCRTVKSSRLARSVRFACEGYIKGPECSSYVDGSEGSETCRLLEVFIATK